MYEGGEVLKMQKGMLLLLLALVVVVFPSITLAIKANVDSSQPVVSKISTHNEPIGRCIACH